MSSLGRDLAAIRKEQGLSLEALQEITKLSPSILQSIEDNSIFDEIDTNTTYVRNYVRNYGKAVEVEEPKIVLALDQVEANQYKGGIRFSAGDKEEADAENSDQLLKDSKEMVHDHSPEYSTEKPAAKANMTKEIGPARRVSSIDWAAIGKKRSKSGVKQSQWGKALIILLILVLLAALVLLFFYFSNGTDNSNPVQTSPATIQQPLIPADSVEESLLPDQNKVGAVLTRRALPDTLSISVIAASGKLEPVRVYTDLAGTRRPYWIELHDTMRFNFVDTFRVRAVDQYERLKLVFKGHEIRNYYEKFYNAETKMVELDRSIIENHLKMEYSE